MDAGTFLDNFAVVAGAPGGVERLRNLVLALSVRGRLVEQLQSDDSVDDLLTSVPVARQAMIAERIIGKPRFPEGVAVAEVPYEVPETWRWRRLADVGAIVGGGTPRSDEPRYWSQGQEIAWLTPADMRSQSSRLIQRGSRDITAVGLAESSAQILPVGSVLFSSRAPIGHVGIVVAPLATNQGFKSCVPYIPSMSEYLFLFLKQVGPSVDASANGTTFREVSGRDVALIPVPLPPLAEQDRIVAKVDELMGLCDELEARQQRRRHASTQFRTSALDALTAAKCPGERSKAWARVSSSWPTLTDTADGILEIRAALAQLAVSGALTAQNPAEAPAAAAIEQASHAKPEFRRKQTEIRRNVENRSALPAGWSWAQVDDLFLVTGGLQKTSARRPLNNHFPYLRVANVQRGSLDLAQVERFELQADELNRLRLEAGDLLVVEGNGSESEIGRCARWNGEIANCVHQNHLIRCRPLVPGIERYLMLFLNSPAGIQTMKSLAVTTSGLYNLSVGKIRAIQVPVPPLAEQARILTRYRDLASQCDVLTSDVAARERHEERVSAALLAPV